MIRKSELALYDLVKTTDGLIGVITEISDTKKGITIESLYDEIRIYTKDIVHVRFIQPKCLRHGKRNCEECQSHWLKLRVPDKRTKGV